MKIQVFSLKQRPVLQVRYEVDKVDFSITKIDLRVYQNCYKNKHVHFFEVNFIYKVFDDAHSKSFMIIYSKKVLYAMNNVQPLPISSRFETIDAWGLHLHLSAPYF